MGSREAEKFGSWIRRDLEKGIPGMCKMAHVREGTQLWGSPVHLANPQLGNVLPTCHQGPFNTTVASGELLRTQTQAQILMVWPWRMFEPF